MANEPPDDLQADTEPTTSELTRIAHIEGRRVVVSTRAVLNRFATRVEDAESTALLSRARGATREEAEENALENASIKLGLSDARSTIRRGVEHLPSEVARTSDKEHD